MEFRILGPLEVVDDSNFHVAVGGTRERALLVLLLLSANRLVSSERLVDDLWGDKPPEGALHALRVYMSRLRRALREAGQDGVLVTRHPGYVARVEPDSLDAARFEALLAQGRTQSAHGDHPKAAQTLREALALWRGPALADVVDAPFARYEATRLEEARLAALEERIEADLACGRHGELVAELDTLTRAYSLRERLWGQRMLALYRAGRQAEALRAYQELRSVLGEELGLAPSPSLARLENAILRHEPQLDWSLLSPTGAGAGESPPERGGQVLSEAGPPTTTYAKSDGVKIAYQVVGDGLLDVVVVPGFVSNVDLYWENPGWTQIFGRLTAFCRLILWDKRGTGLSDPVQRVPTLDERADDLLAVMDAARSQRAALFGISEGGPMSLLFAAAHPERVRSLVLYGTSPRFSRAPDWECGWTPAEVGGWLAELEERWGEGALIDLFAPGQAGTSLLVGAGVASNERERARRWAGPLWKPWSPSTAGRSSPPSGSPPSSCTGETTGWP